MEHEPEDLPRNVVGEMRCQRVDMDDQEAFVKQIEDTINGLSCDETFKRTAARRATRDDAIAKLQAVVDLYRSTTLCPTCGGGGRVPKKD